MQSSQFIRSLSISMAAFGLFLYFVSNSANGAKGASIRLPEDFSTSSSSIELTGFLGFNRGRYSSAEFRGEFTRIESRIGIFDPLFVANKGKSSFTIEGPAGEILVSASCGAIERTASYRIVTIDLKKLAYDCDFTGTETSSDFQFVLGEPKREGFRQRLLARDLRTGEALIGGQAYVFDSVHDYQGSRLTSQTPLGYLIKIDGVTVAAVDLLDWNPIVHLADDLSVPQRVNAMTVALALAVLRDPANSALEE